MDSSNCLEGVGDSPLSSQVATQVHISYRDPPPPLERVSDPGKCPRGGGRRSPHALCADGNLPTPPPSNAAALSNTANSSRRATPSHPLPSGRGQIRGQLVPPAHPSSSDARPVLDHFNPRAGIFRPYLASASSGLAQVSQPRVMQAFASWLSFAWWGTPSNLAPTNFAPSGAN